VKELVNMSNQSLRYRKKIAKISFVLKTSVVSHHQLKKKLKHKLEVSEKVQICIYCTDILHLLCSKIRLAENVFPLTPPLTVTLKHNNVFGLTKYVIFRERYRYPVVLLQKKWLCIVNKIYFFLVL